MDSRLALPVNTVLDGSYRIMRVVGAGGFGITYEAEDINLGTMVAIKEYYPFDFGDRDHTMSVRPKSERHKQTFDWGKASFLEEARTLARFEHPSIVRVTRVFEANSTAYMVMRFEQGLSFEAWLSSLGRAPAQEELDSVTAPLLDALQMMHAANFLHRDIAPDNIIIRPDGTPVLLDFGAARRAVAEMSRSLTGIVKAGYSPHEQYTSDGRLQGPWSDLYALGGTLYRAVVGKPPEEATLRFDEDHMASAQQSAKGKYRREFLAAIDTCLKVRHSERPRSVAQLRPMLLGAQSPAKGEKRLVETYKIPSGRVLSMPKAASMRRVARRWPAIAASLVLIAGAYGGYEYRQASLAQRDGSKPPAATEAERQAALETERLRQKEAADAHQRQIEEARRNEDEEKRIAALEETKRKQEEARKDEEDRRRAEEDKRREERRIAAAQEDKRKEEERVRMAALPNDDQRAAFVKKIQEVLKKNQCYSGAVNGRSNDAQDGLDEFVRSVGKKGKGKVRRIELAKASVGEFESWLKDADEISGIICVPQPKPTPKTVAEPEKPRKKSVARAPHRQRDDPPPRRSSPGGGGYSGGGGGYSGGGGGGGGPIQGVR